jgi:hypothetical protein
MAQHGFYQFTIFLYHILRQRVHPVIAGALLLIFTMIPEVYSYSFMILYDYSNMVFFFLSLYFLFDHFGDKDKRKTYLYFAGFLMGIATYIRSETLVLGILFLPLLVFIQLREKYPIKKIALASVLFIIPSLVAYYLSTQFYIKYYLPVHYNIGSQVNDHLSNLQPLLQRYKEIVTRLMTGSLAIQLWGYILYLFFFFFLAELIFLRRFSKEARNWLYAIIVVYLGLGILGWLLPLMSLLEGTKRGLFKLFPLLLLYLASNGWVIRLSSLIGRWENTGASKSSVPVQTTPPKKRHK